MSPMHTTLKVDIISWYPMDDPNITSVKILQCQNHCMTVQCLHFYKQVKPIIDKTKTQSKHNIVLLIEG